MEGRNRFGHVQLKPIVVVGDGLRASHVGGAESFARFDELRGSVSVNCVFEDGRGGVGTMLFMRVWRVSRCCCCLVCALAVCEPGTCWDMVIGYTRE